jgi:hypothetical protein
VVGEVVSLAAVDLARAPAWADNEFKSTAERRL